MTSYETEEDSNVWFDPPEATEEFDPPVDIVVDPPGYQTRLWEDVCEVQYDGPDARLVMAYGGTYVTNRRVIRVAEDDHLDRSLQEADNE